MSQKTWKLTAAGVLVACGLGAVAWGVAQATPPKGVLVNAVQGPFVLDEITALNHTPDYTAVVKTTGESDTYVQDVTIAPGGYSGWHSHPGISFVMVQSGTLTLYDECNDFVPQVYPAGTG